MILTLTANPSLDRTVELPAQLNRGEVQRAIAVRAESGGKGVNVSRALSASGLPTLALLPGDPSDPVLLGLSEQRIPFRALPIGAALRSNITLTEPDGTTTKVNEPGPTLSAEQQQELTQLVLQAAAGASWLVLAGSLPPGLPQDYYLQLSRALHAGLREAAPKIAVDSSGAPLAAMLSGRPPQDPAPDLLKPNGEELAELARLAGLGGQHSGPELEAEPRLAASVAAALVQRGVGAVLVTLGGNGAILVTPEGAWHAIHAPIKVASTVGAGDSALAGYLLAQTAGQAPEQCLRQAVAHGSAAASLPGSTVPETTQTTPDAVTVTALN